jgi:hypothetical protein
MKLPTFALAIALIAGCSAPVAVATPAPSPTPSPTVSPSAVAPTPSPSPSMKIVAFPDDLPIIVGTPSGDLFFQTKGAKLTGRTVHACGSDLRDLSTYGRRALFTCGGSREDPSALYLYDDTTGAVTMIVRTERAGAALTATNGLVYQTMGAAVANAPILMGRLMLRDLRTGADTIIDERFGVAFDVWRTPDGVAVWRPQNSLAFRRPESESGTWLLKGTSLTRLSLYRLIDGSAGRYLLETEPVDANGFLTSGTGTSYLLLRTGTTETRLTPADIANEQGVALLADGRVVAWRPSPNDPYAGTMVLYKDGVVVRTDPGTFGTLRLQRSGDWIIGNVFDHVGRVTLAAYRLSDGAFASIYNTDIRTIGILGP